MGYIKKVIQECAKKETFMRNVIKIIVVASEMFCMDPTWKQVKTV